MFSRELNLSDLQIVEDLIKNVISEMQKNNIDQWDEKYPNKIVLLEDLKSGNAIGFFIDNEIVGYVVINEKQSEEYKTINWNYKNRKILVIHRLCINLKFQRKGYAKKMLIFIEEYCKINKFRVIRLDAFIKNIAALKLYENYLYTFCGTVFF